MNKPSDELKTGYIKVQLNYAPKTNGKKFEKWCEDNGFTPLASGRRAWSSSFGTYLRDASGIAYSDGEAFLFYEEDLIDLEDIERKARKTQREIINLYGVPQCNSLHHPKKYQHTAIEDCPVEARLQALTKEDKIK